MGKRRPAEEPGLARTEVSGDLYNSNHSSSPAAAASWEDEEDAGPSGKH